MTGWLKSYLVGKYNSFVLTKILDGQGCFDLLILLKTTGGCGIPFPVRLNREKLFPRARSRFQKVPSEM